MKRLEELTDAWLEGNLDEPRTAELRRLLHRPDHAEAFVRRCAEEQAIAAAVRAGGPRAAPRPRRPARRVAPALMTGLAVAATLVLAIAWWPDPTSERTNAPPEAVAAIATREGTTVCVHDDTHRSPADGAAYAGDRVVTGADGRAEVRLVDGTTCDLVEDTALLLHAADELAVERGTVAVDARPFPPSAPLRIATPHAQCEVVGTRFTLEVQPTRSLLSVASGSVAWIPDGEPRRLITAGARDVAGAPLPPPVSAPLVRWRFTAGEVVRMGHLDESFPIIGRTPLAFEDDALLVDLRDHVTSPYRVEQPALLAALRAAERVRFAVRVRFLTPVLDNALLAELQCTKPLAEDVPKLLQIRWLGGAVVAEDRAYTIAATIDRSGMVRITIDGREVHNYLRSWPFDGWSPWIQLKLLAPFGHHGEPTTPMQVAYEEVLIDVE